MSAAFNSLRVALAFVLLGVVGAQMIKSTLNNATNTGISNVITIQMIKAHGIMMIMAWFIFVATAIMFARYFKRHMPDTKPNGVHIWFHFHRAFNMLALLLIGAAFVLIFISQEKWNGPTPTHQTWGANHSMTGILAVSLAMVQPFLAIFRCHPGKPLRPIFNWLHRCVGIAAWALAATSIVIASQQFTGWWSDMNAASALVIAYLAFLGAVIILQELLTICDMVKGRSSSLINVLEVDSGGKGPVSPSMPTTVSFPTSSKTKLVRSLLMGLFMVIGWGLAIAMIVLIAIA